MNKHPFWFSKVERATGGLFFTNFFMAQIINFNYRIKRKDHADLSRQTNTHTQIGYWFRTSKYISTHLNKNRDINIILELNDFI